MSLFATATALAVVAVAAPVLSASAGTGRTATNPTASPTASPAASAASAPRGADQLSRGGAFILRARDGRVEALERDARAAGADVRRRLAIIDSLSVRVTPAAGKRLAGSPALAAVAIDGVARPQQTSRNEITDVRNDKGSMQRITAQVRADQLWSSGATGAGVDIAVIDTGVAPVQGLAGKIVNALDISLDIPFTTTRGLDAFGHGTHMASIAAGLDPNTTNLTDSSKFVGVAPGARIVNVKVGSFDGATDVSQVIAGIDWVVQNRRANGMNIRVLNLSYGSPSSLNPADDPLAWAAEVAWRNGIVVVAAAGNDGAETRVLSPASNPVILAVGALDQTKSQWTAADFTATSGPRQPDVWAPGRSVLGLRVPGSFVDRLFPTAAVGTRLFRGTGTSQATAVASGAAALLVSANPTATPAQVKAAIMRSGRDALGQPSGVLDIARANTMLRDGSLAAVVDPPLSGIRGTGPINAVRGGRTIVANGVPLQGEIDIFGAAWNSASWAQKAATLDSWRNGRFNGNSWSGNSWSGNSWSGNSWSGNSWSSNAWAGNSWSGNSWSGNSWSGNSWSGNSWSGNSWSGNSWSGVSWQGAVWG
jgi:serine protease AprX